MDTIHLIHSNDSTVFSQLSNPFLWKLIFFLKLKKKQKKWETRADAKSPPII
jgi:hypothetical protein